jgi:hypothetical protein
MVLDARQERISDLLTARVLLSPGGASTRCFAPALLGGGHRCFAPAGGDHAALPRRGDHAALRRAARRPADALPRRGTDNPG